MKLKDLIKKLQEKPEQDAEVEFIVYNTEDGKMACCDLTGPTTSELVRQLSKEFKKTERVVV